MASQSDIDAAVAQILALIDAEDFAVLANGTADLLGRVSEASGHDALLTLGFKEDSDASLFDVVNEHVVATAKKRGAELVGMKYDEDGKLIPNPNPKWATSDGTRELLRGTVQDAVEEGWSAKQLADAVEQHYAFSESRAEMIGRTEIARAQGQGNLAAWKNSGVVSKKSWLLGSEHDDDDECDDNSDAGQIAIDDEFPSGDDAEPAHPRCVCVTVAHVEDESE